MQRRSIPVHTGKPKEAVLNFYAAKVYPRTHGETIKSCPKSWPETSRHCGLSPYTRGNRVVALIKLQIHRSIPVHTGKPPSQTYSAPSKRVYPRTHGETVVALSKIIIAKGLSPYTRGNLMSIAPNTARSRSIPVHTGKPGFATFPDTNHWVYPRTHGETMGIPLANL